MTDHIYFDKQALTLRLLDQRLLPNSRQFLSCATYKDVISAIKNMAVRGAPAIGVAAAWACCLAALEYKTDPNWRNKYETALSEIAAARPTAVNLSWAVKRMAKAALNQSGDIIQTLLNEACAIQTEDIEICRQIGQNGASLIKDGDTILTHCNAGALATAGYGTALGIIRAAKEQGKQIKVIADETRPLLQGSRLTAFELAEDNIPVTVACDNACALILGQGAAQLVITGADRIAANGDTANKIGTCGVAIIARHYNIPFYIAAPLSTIDREIPAGSRIPIEQREEKEVTEMNGAPLAPAGVRALNFAFDVTPASLISGIITEKGILRPPYADSISQLFEQKRV